MKTSNSKTKNLDMNDKVYKLRRAVMDFIYEAKEVVDLPRITVRITEDHETMLGCARLKENILWITKRAIDSYDLRSVVYHEIAHAVYGAGHDVNCPLMKPSTDKQEKLTKAQCQKILKRISEAI